MLETLIHIAEEHPDGGTMVPNWFILAVRDMRDAGKLVVNTQGEYDIEYLDHTIKELGQ